MTLRTTHIVVFSGCHETMMKDKADYKVKMKWLAAQSVQTPLKYIVFRLVLALSVGDSKRYIVS